jgi:hypothetical protein
VAEKKPDADAGRVGKPEVGGLSALVARARKGDETAVSPLRDYLKRLPELVHALGGDLAEQAEVSFVKAAAGQDLAFREALTGKLAQMRAELAGPEPSPLERLLVERVVACWLQVQDADVRYAQAKDLTPKWGTYFQDRMDRANRRYLMAVKALATIRKLAVPVLQVNIARKQVNIAGPVPGAEG